MNVPVCGYGDSHAGDLYSRFCGSLVTSAYCAQRRTPNTFLHGSLGITVHSPKNNASIRQEAQNNDGQFVKHLHSLRSVAHLDDLAD
jgi:hypothetical protein